MDILLRLQSLRTPAMDVFFSLITHLGDEVFVVVILAVYLWSVERKFALRMGMVFFMGGMICQLIKLSVMMPRPWMLDPAVIPVPAAVPAATGWSLPSGHTMSATTLFGCLLLRVGKPWQKGLCAAMALLVAFSRLYLGVHTPLDVGTSLLAGALITALTWAWMRKAETSHTARAALELVTAALTAGLLALSLVRYGQEYDYGLIEGGFTGVGAAAGFLTAWLATRSLRYEERASPPTQIVRIAVGLGGILLLKEGIPLLIGENPIGTTLSYALVALWAVWAYPALLSKVKIRKRETTT